MTMQKVLILGAGKIGSLITTMLAESGSYEVHVGSLETDETKKLIAELGLAHVTVFPLDAQDEQALDRILDRNPDRSGNRSGAGQNGDSKFDSVISGLPYYCNTLVADLAAKHGLNYFDLTEDVGVTRHVRNVSEGSDNIFMPQCGLAPGFISIVANSLMKNFEMVDMVKMRVGALPVNPNNALKYSLTWSTDGLINEYGNTCYGIENGEFIALQPLEGYETITLDGVLYEAFNTSGGLGTLCESYDGMVRMMNYKTLRYPGHCKKIDLLMNELRLNEDRGTLKRILERAIPKTLQDVVLLYVAVAGKRNGQFLEESYVKKVYPQKIAGKLWSSIQITTAAGICSVMDVVLENRARFHGFVTQESLTLEEVTRNRFGKYYA